jgi:hypothetical protein
MADGHFKLLDLHQTYYWGRRDRMVVGYITTYATSAYQH